MKTKSIFLTTLIAACLLTSFLGCSTKDDESQEKHATETASSSQISTEPSSETGGPASVAAKPEVHHEEMVHEETETSVRLRDVLSSWDAGDKERATEQFNKVNWEHPEVFANVPIFNLSEQDFMASSQDQQLQFMQDAKEFATKLRKLGLHVLAAGDATLASGKKQVANVHYEAVLTCAKSIASKDCYELFQLTAKGLIKATEDKLSQL